MTRIQLELRLALLQRLADAMVKEWKGTGYCPMPKNVCRGEDNEGFASDCNGYREHSKACPLGAYLRAAKE